ALLDDPVRVVHRDEVLRLDVEVLVDPGRVEGAERGRLVGRPHGRDADLRGGHGCHSASATSIRPISRSTRLISWAYGAGTPPSPLLRGRRRGAALRPGGGAAAHGPAAALATDSAAGGRRRYAAAGADLAVGGADAGGRRLSRASSAR